MFRHINGEEQQRQAEIKVAGPKVSIEEKVFTFVWIAGHCVERPFSQPRLSCSLASSHQARTLFILLFQCRTCKFGHLVCVGRQKLSPSSADPHIQDERRGTTHRQEDDLTADFRSMRNRVCKNSATLAMLTHDITMPALRQHIAQIQSTS